MKKVIKKVASWFGKLRGKNVSSSAPDSRKSLVPAQREKRQADEGRTGRYPKQQSRRPEKRPRTDEGTGERRSHRSHDSTKANSNRKVGHAPSPTRTGPRPERHPDRRHKPSPSHEQQTIAVGASDDAWDVSQFPVEPELGKTRFHDLDLPKPIMHAIADLNFKYCTPIQSGVLPKSLAGQDVIGQAQTGTGKSAAFLITILAHLYRNPADPQRRKGTPRALILAPTRELVLQIENDAQALSKYMPIRIVSVFGGMHYERQKRRLDALVDIVVATPGRLIDFKSQNIVHLNHVEILVIDEADRMLDMGFIPDIRTIVHSTPTKDKRQTLFFSATVTQDVMRLAGHWTRDAHKEAIEPEQIAVNTVDQKIYITTTDEKFTILYNMISQQNLERVIVFCNRRDETQKIYEGLLGRGISCGLLSGDVDQRKRIRTLEELRSGAIRVLVATDVAARGLHIEGISHVINYNLPLDPEDYVHRIGRTGRAGALGTSVSFACEEDGVQIPVIEEFIGRKLEYVYPPNEWLQPIPEPSVAVPKEHPEQKQRFGHQGGPRRGRRRRGGDHTHRRGSGSNRTSGGTAA